MHTTGGRSYPNDLSLDVRPRHNLVDKKDLFLCEYGKFILHKKFVVEGMLSPCTSPFYTLTEIIYIETNNRNKDAPPTITKSNITKKLQSNRRQNYTAGGGITPYEKHDEENSAN